MKNKILTLISTIALLAAVGCLSGCKTRGTLLTPASVTSDVRDGIEIGLAVYPAATPEVASARDVICTEVAKTNLNPARIIADLSSLNITNKGAILIINGGVLIYNNVLKLLDTNSIPTVQPYLDALCQGFSQALPSGPMARRAPRQLPPHLQ